MAAEMPLVRIAAPALRALIGQEYLLYDGAAKGA